MKLTIGMSCYNDYDGVWFTINSILQYHPEVRDDIRFVVIDGNPDSAHGQACERLIAKLKNRHGNCGLYVKNVSWASTASRDYVFQFATTPYVLCVDSHVMIAPGVLRKLIDHYDSNPQCNDLIQGPLYDENGDLFATEMTPVWDYNMYGKWGKNHDLANGTEPWNVELMGLGLFSCTKQAWPGFNPAFRGFGGEEGYIHRKFINNGGKCTMYPWLKWIHRFDRPGGVPYLNEYVDRLKNYLIGWYETGQDVTPIMDYFCKSNTQPGQERDAFTRPYVELLYTQCKQIVDRQKNMETVPDSENAVINDLNNKIKQLQNTIEQLTVDK